MAFRQRLFEIIEPGEKRDIPSKIFDYSIIILIFLNVAAIILESFQIPRERYGQQLRIFEIASVVVFSIEYMLRLLTADLKFPRKIFVGSLLKYIFSFMALIDLAAILPFYLPMFFVIDLRFIRILRLVRLVRIFKIHRYTETLNILGDVLKRKKEELLVTVFITVLLLLLASSLMYYAETDVQPDNFPNIIASFWWAIATLTTVGYGDVYPVTALGKVLSGVIALLGIGLVALPTGIISSGFIEEVQTRRGSVGKRESVDYPFCPHCGKRLP